MAAPRAHLRIMRESVRSSSSGRPFNGIVSGHLTVRIWPTIVGIVAIIGAVVAFWELRDPYSTMITAFCMLVAVGCRFLAKVTSDPAISTSDSPPSDYTGSGPL